MAADNLHSEAAHIKHFQQGDETAFKWLFDQLYVAILYYAQSIIEEKAEAQDIVQEIFYKLWQKRTDFDSLLHIQSFLYKSTRFACIDKLRQLHSRERREEIFTSNAMDEALNNSRIIEEELYREIITEINQLPEKYRTILKLKYLNNLDYSQIARQLGLSEATVRKQKQRAIEMLRTMVLKKHAAKNSAKPFKVSGGGQEIEVLGTAFNVNAYNEEPFKTSLAEGAIKINQFILKPGQAYQQGKVITTNIEQDLAWKSGLFNFNNADLQTVMRQISRWYDVEIVYEGRIPPVKFIGELKRNLNLPDVLEVLQKTDVHFKVKGKKIIVMP